MFAAQDYQAEMEAFQRKTEQDHIIDWVEQEVVKSITPQLVCLAKSHNIVTIHCACKFMFCLYVEVLFA